MSTQIFPSRWSFFSALRMFFYCLLVVIALLCASCGDDNSSGPSRNEDVGSGVDVSVSSSSHDAKSSSSKSLLSEKKSSSSTTLSSSNNHSGQSMLLGGCIVERCESDAGRNLFEGSDNIGTFAKDIRIHRNKHLEFIDALRDSRIALHDILSAAVHKVIQIVIRNAEQFETGAVCKRVTTHGDSVGGTDLLEGPAEKFGGVAQGILKHTQCSEIFDSARTTGNEGDLAPAFTASAIAS